jgi:hypothetical protein
VARPVKLTGVPTERIVAAIRTGLGRKVTAITPRDVAGFLEWLCDQDEQARRFATEKRRGLADAEGAYSRAKQLDGARSAHRGPRADSCARFLRLAVLGSPRGLQRLSPCRARHCAGDVAGEVGFFALTATPLLS